MWGGHQFLVVAANGGMKAYKVRSLRGQKLSPFKLSVSGHPGGGQGPWNLGIVRATLNLAKGDFCGNSTRRKPLAELGFAMVMTPSESLDELCESRPFSLIIMGDDRAVHATFTSLWELAFCKQYMPNLADPRVLPRA